MFAEYDQDKNISSEFVHVMGWNTTQSEFAELLPDILKAMKPWMTKISFFYVPAETGGARINLQCCPSVYNSVRDKVRFI